MLLTLCPFVWGCSGSATGAADGSPAVHDASGGDADTDGSIRPHVTLPESGVLCSEPRPSGADQAAAPKAYSAGTCPELTAGRNVLRTGDEERELLLLLPDELDPNESLPVLFFWHWLGGNADSFLDYADLARAAREQRFIAVVPDSKRDTAFRWPYTTEDSQERLDEELRFFDDMLSCVAEQLPVNLDCVGSVGVSAGALWTAQLAGERAEHLASIVSLSGGTGGNFLRPMPPASHKMPALVLWGGPGDFCVVIDFEQASTRLAEQLTDDGHFLVECVHNCGHAVPPVEGPDGMSQFALIWQFVLQHPFWLRDGESPYEPGLPSGYPDWCGVGPGSATIRTGVCPDAPGC